MKEALGLPPTGTTAVPAAAVAVPGPSSAPFAVPGPSGAGPAVAGPPPIVLEAVSYTHLTLPTTPYV